MLDQAGTHRIEKIEDKFLDLEEDYDNEHKRTDKKMLKMEKLSKKYVEKLNDQLQRLIAFVEENNRKQT